VLRYEIQFPLISTFVLSPILITMSPYIKSQIKSTLQVVVLLAIIVTIAISATSCKDIPQSYPEKVVIIDAYEITTPASYDSNTGYKYKCRRIEVDKTVSVWIYEPDLYESGDTIYHTFD
jgi:hypothetical protein